MLRKWIISFILFGLAVLVFGGGVVRRAHGAELPRITPPRTSSQTQSTASVKIKPLACGCRWYENEDGSRHAEEVFIVSPKNDDNELTVVYVRIDGKLSSPKQVDADLIETNIKNCPKFHFMPSSPNFDFSTATDSGKDRDEMGRARRRRE